eukprot:CAMPEP_0202741790 /NCGR_PEP_ID=MMETSP1388-20130828/4566_1 /ASSEMBLY_ACC=CAM_ASM_000864 /TAXON_ID=37098 /ORGANISM="Isochrysis sp, Strain CCMP1244" /LENGTH=63 /DNA_ID=CAMNT_0049408655 /DNA_START=1 /DNA_END=192 /DNA_ORIENTATION=+
MTYGMSTPLGDGFFEAAAHATGRLVGELRFCFDGERIAPSQSPAELSMEAGDVIDIFFEQRGD